MYFISNGNGNGENDDFRFEVLNLRSNKIFRWSVCLMMANRCFG